MTQQTAVLSVEVNPIYSEEDHSVTITVRTKEGAHPLDVRALLGGLNLSDNAKISASLYKVNENFSTSESVYYVLSVEKYYGITIYLLRKSHEVLTAYTDREQAQAIKDFINLITLDYKKYCN